MKRRLATILAADVVGYSRLMAADEEGTLSRLGSCMQQVEALVAEHGGRIFGAAGDSMIVEFSSAVEAVTCAVRIQHDLDTFNAGLPDNQAMRMRIGLNLGDVIVKDGNLFGDGVNIAARLEPIAAAGGICLSQAVYDQVRNKLEYTFGFLGERELKNIPELVRTYEIDTGTATLGDTKAVAEAFSRPSVAVLPFENLSGDPEQDYFSDGLSEDLITALTLWRSFPVIARNSSFAYKGRKSGDARQIGRELGASYLVEGSVRKSSNRVRITAQLVDASSAHQVWANRYDRVLEDIFELQDEITEQIAAIVEPTLEKAEMLRSRTKTPDSLDAWDYYLRGRSFMHDWDDTEKAREMFTKAIELDPDYCEAYADLAWTYSRDMMVEKVDDRAVHAEKMLKAARHAVSLDERSSLASYRLSSAYIWRNEHDLAILEGRRAVELNPMYAVARHSLGNKLDLIGDADGIEMMVQAEQLNPRDPQRNMQLTFLARAYVNAQDYQKAVACAREALKVQPNYPNAHYILALAYGHLGRQEEARIALSECDRIQPGFSARRANWQPYVDEGRNEHLRDGLRLAGLA